MKKIKDIAKYELIGMIVEIIDAKNKHLVGIKGRIIDETRNMITLENGNRIIKEQVKLKMRIGNKSVEVDGRILVGRPEDRIKKARKVKW